MRLGGHRVLNVVRVSWAPLDPKQLRNATIIGRCDIVLERDQRIPALLFASTDTRTLGERFAVYFHEPDERFIVVPMDRREEP